MRNDNKTQLLICLFLCIALLFASVSGCKPSIKNPLKTSVSSSQTSSSESSSSQIEESSSSDPVSDIDQPIEDGDTEEDTAVVYEKLQILNNAPPLNNNFLGFNMVYHAFTFMPDKYGRQYTDLQAKTELDRLENMGVNTVRTFYSSEWAFDTTANTWNWDSPKMKAYWRWCSELQKRNINIAMASLWQLAPLERDTDISFQMPGIFVKDDLEASLKNYGTFMSETLKQAKSRGIQNIKYLMAFTEPNNSHITNPGYIRDEPRSFTLYAKAVKQLDASLKSAGIRSDYKIVGPNDNIDSSYSYFLDHAVQELNDCIDIYGSHASYVQAPQIVDDYYYDYVTDNYPDRLSLVKKTGKQYWIDEVNIKVSNWTKPLAELVTVPWSGTQQASFFTAAMNSGMQNLFLWTGVDQQWPDNTTTNDDGFTNGVQRHGLFPSLFESTIPKPTYYSFSLLSKYTGTGGQTFEGVTENDGNGLHISSERLKDGNWTVVVANAGYMDIDLNVEFQKAIGKTFYRHVYSPSDIVPTTKARMIAADKYFSNVKSDMFDTLPGGAVAVYTTVKD